jgi:hypothetical protein
VRAPRRCPPGATGDGIGEDGCVDVDDCAANPCGLGNCTDRYQPTCTAASRRDGTCTIAGDPVPENLGNYAGNNYVCTCPDDYDFIEKLEGTGDQAAQKGTCEEHKPCDRNADDARGIPNCWAMSEGRLSTYHAAACSAADDVCCCLSRVSRTRLASSRHARRRRCGRPSRHVHAPRPERLQVRCRGLRTLVTLGGC